MQFEVARLMIGFSSALKSHAVISSHECIQTSEHTSFARDLLLLTEKTSFHRL